MKVLFALFLLALVVSINCESETAPAQDVSDKTSPVADTSDIGGTTDEDEPMRDDDDIPDEDDTHPDDDDTKLEESDIARVADTETGNDEPAQDANAKPFWSRRRNGRRRNSSRRRGRFFGKK